MKEESTIGGDGVRALTSTTFRVSDDSDDATEDADTSIEASSYTARDVGTAPGSARYAALPERGDADRDRGTTSTTFIADEEELVDESVYDEDMFGSAVWL